MKVYDAMKNMLVEVKDVIPGNMTTDEYVGNEYTHKDGTKVKVTKQLKNGRYQLKVLYNPIKGGHMGTVSVPSEEINSKNVLIGGRTYSKVMATDGGKDVKMLDIKYSDVIKEGRVVAGKKEEDVIRALNRELKDREGNGYKAIKDKSGYFGTYVVTRIHSGKGDGSSLKSFSLVKLDNGFKIIKPGGTGYKGIDEGLPTDEYIGREYSHTDGTKLKVEKKSKKGYIVRVVHNPVRGGQKGVINVPLDEINFHRIILGGRTYTKDARVTLPANVKRKANAITAKYCKGFIEPKELQRMYKELEQIGVSVGMVYGDATKGAKTAEVYYNNERVDNSLFVYSVYEDKNSIKNEYTIYFS